MLTRHCVWNVSGSTGVIAGIEEKSPVDFFLLFFSSKILQLIHTEKR